MDKKRNRCDILWDFTSHVLKYRLKKVRMLHHLVCCNLNTYTKLNHSKKKTYKIKILYFIILKIKIKILFIKIKMSFIKIKLWNISYQYCFLIHGTLLVPFLIFLFVSGLFLFLSTYERRTHLIKFSLTFHNFQNYDKEKGKLNKVMITIIFVLQNKFANIKNFC